MAVIFRMALRNVLKNWRHSLAAILTISAGLISYVVFSGFMGLIESAYQEAFRYRDMYGDLIIENKDLTSPKAKADPFKFYLSPEDQDRIEAVLGKDQEKIFSKVRFLEISGLATNDQASGIVSGYGYDAKAGAQMRGPVWAWDTTYGDPLYLSQQPYPLLLGQTLGRNFDCVPSEKVYEFNAIEGYPAEHRPFQCARPEVQLSLLTETGTLNAIDFQVTGLVDAGYRDLDVSFIQTTLEAAQTLLHTKKISYLTLQLKNPNQSSQFIAALNKTFTESLPHLKAYAWIDHPVGEIFVKTMELLNVFKVFVVTVILSISFLSTFNTMVKIVRERIREIGTLRSFGFVRSRILLLFSLEAFLLSCLGTLLGALGAGLISGILNMIRIPYKAGMMSEPTLFLIQFQPMDYILAFFLLGLLTVLTALYACREPIHKSVAENLAFV